MKSISRSATWPCLVLLALAQAACSSESEPDGPAGSGGRPGSTASGGATGSGGSTPGSGGAGTGGAAAGSGGASGAGGGSGGGGSGGGGGANTGGSSADGAAGTDTSGSGGSTVDARGGDGGGEGPASADTWDSFALPFMVKYCVSCHNDDKAGDAARDYHMLAVVMREKVGIACGTAKSQADRTSRGCAANAPRANQFPPGNGPKPTPDERDRLLRWIDANLP